MRFMLYFRWGFFFGIVSYRGHTLLSSVLGRVLNLSLMIIYDHDDSLTKLTSLLRDSLPQNHTNQVLIMTVVDQDLALELELYAGHFSSVHINSIGRTLTKFWRKGSFDYERALDYVYRNLVIPAAKDYKVCHGSLNQSWHTMFPIPERKLAAENVLNQFVGEFKLNNFWS